MTAVFDARAIGENIIYGVNHYVPNMGYVAGMNSGLLSFTVNTGSEINAADADAILTGMDLDAGATQTFLPAAFNGVLGGTTPFELSAPFGQCLSVTPSGDVGVTDAVINLFGRDWLGQPMRETLTITDATAVVGKKAFKWLDKITNDGGATGATTGTVGVVATIGLPFATSKVLAETSTVLATGVTVDETPLGTFVEADGTYPATATSGDPRGTYVPAHALDGTERATLLILCEPIIQIESGVQYGGLHGVPHYYA